MQVAINYSDGYTCADKYAVMEYWLKSEVVTQSV